MSWLKRLLGEGFILKIWWTGRRREYVCVACKEDGYYSRATGPNPREATLRAVKEWKKDNE